MSIRHFRFALARGEVRTADFRGTRHVVVPVVMLTEGILHASNADEKELVLASEFSQRVNSWNGRPIMNDHPEVDGVPVSANSPKVLEGRQLGNVYNVRVEGKKLKGEAWLNPDLVAAAGSDILTRINAGEVVEVSVGVTVHPDETPGDFDGQRYAAIWRNITPDHLAMLPAGKPGACNISMGCGAPRAAAIRSATIKHVGSKWILYTKDGTKKLGEHSSEAEALAQERAIEVSKHSSRKGEMKIKEKLTALAAHFTRAAEAGMEEDGSLSSESGVNDLRNDLWDQLYARVPAFGGIVDIFPDAKMVIYSTIEGSATEGPSESCLYRVSYSMSGDEPVLGDDAVEVEKVTEYEPVEAGEGEEGDEMLMASGKMKLAAASYNSAAKKADAASSDAKAASASAEEDGSAESHDAAADAHSNAALAHGHAAMAAKSSGNGTAQAAHVDAKAQHEQAASQHSDKAMEAQKETAPTNAENGKQKTASASGCGCGGANIRAAKGEDMKKEEVVARILSHKNTPFKAEDAAVLSQLTEAGLVAIEARCAAAAGTETPAAKPAEITRERVLELFPDIAGVVAEHQQREASRRAELVDALKTLGAFSEDELKELPLPMLEKTAKAVAAVQPKNALAKPKVDFSGLGVSRGAAADTEAVPAPPSLKDRLAAARGQKAS